jgi:hypothetical protein
MILAIIYFFILSPSIRHNPIEVSSVILASHQPFKIRPDIEPESQPWISQGQTLDTSLGNDCSLSQVIDRGIN